METPGFVAVTQALIAFSTWRILRFRGRRRTAEVVALTLLALALFFAITVEMQFRQQKREVLNSDLNIIQPLGRHLIVGYRKLDELGILVSRGAVGGIFITHRNVRGQTAEQISADLRSLQSLRKSQGLPPLMIATDQEGGIVSRLSPPLTTLPPLSSLTAVATPAEMEAQAAAYGDIHGKELAALGVTINLSPIVDLKYSRRSNLLDTHSLIDKRAISDDPATVSRIALAYSRGLESHGVIPTLKHFPGMGRITADTHHFKAAVTASKDELQVSDWVPFRYLIERSSAFMMLGHALVPDIDPKNPASCSSALVQGIIRNEWKHEGVLITDDLTMGAIHGSELGVCGAAVAALNAGVDLLLVSYDDEKYFEAMHCVMQAKRAGKLNLELLRKSAMRLERTIINKPCSVSHNTADCDNS
jgi:beta-N-acetylhexosaminidase